MRKGHSLSVLLIAFFFVIFVPSIQAGPSGLVASAPGGSYGSDQVGSRSDALALTTYAWHTFYGSIGNDYGHAIATDGSGNVYVTGNSEASWNGPAGESPLHAHSGGFSDIFVLKLDSGGAYQWHTFYGSASGDGSNAIATDGSGNVYVKGVSDLTWNGPAGEIPIHAHSGVGNGDIVVLKLGSSGAYQWHTFHGSVNGYGTGIATDGNGNLYVTGYSYATWNGPGGESPLHAYGGIPGPHGTPNTFVLKLDGSGFYQWHTFYGSAGGDEGNAIATDGSGNVYVTGDSGSTWNGPAGESPLHAHTGFVDIFVLKLESGGAYQWHAFYGSSHYDYSYGIATTGSGNVYVTGSSLATWSGPVGQIPLHAHSGDLPGGGSYYEVFVLKLDSSGAYQWHTFYGSSSWDDAYGIATDKSGNVYVMGDSGSTWNGPAGQTPLHAHSGEVHDSDMFVLKLDSSGAYQWHTFYRIGIGLGIATDDSGNVYVTGSSLATWSGPTGQSPLHAHSGRLDIFVLKLSGTSMSCDFDGDGKTDIAVYRASTGTWYVIPSGGGAPDGFGWGGDPTDKPVPGDYDGDGKTDYSVYRNSVWFIYPSGVGSPYALGWGIATDKPVPGDYDGDGKTDYAVYRDGVWFVYPSGGEAPYAVGWGDATDRPVAEDYDGDGKTDYAVYRNGLWFVYPSGGGSAYALGWGIATDKPVLGDYDGDGKADCAVYRDGVWFVYLSGGASAYAVDWGMATDKPVPGDYDGDGKTDIAVYRPGTGAWYIIPSGGASPYGVGWGGDASDIPVTTNPALM